MKKPIPTEHAEQVVVVKWFRAQFSRVLIFAVPNGGKRHMKTAIALKKEGVVSGVPDLFIPEWSLWIEMKRQKGGKLSNEQESIIRYLENIGHHVIVAKGAQSAVDQILDFIIHLKEKKERSKTSETLRSQ